MNNAIINGLDSTKIEVRESTIGVWIYGVDSGGVSAVSMSKQQAIELCVEISNIAGIDRELSRMLGFES